jgi:hypothetical protein
MAKEATVKKKRFDGTEVEVLAETYEPGATEMRDKNDWESRLQDKNEILKFLQSGLRYWYAKEGFGSEKRKNPA